MTPAATPWPPALAGSPAVAVIERAIARQRLSHSVLLQGDDPGTLAELAYAIADRLLNPPGARSAYDAEHHPDCFSVRPVSKMRMIRADEIRALIAQVQVSPAIGARKVAVLHEADRMNASAANIFLKTLEEPPADTTLLLLSTRPHALLPTIRSRVLQFRFPAAVTPTAAEGWSDWLADYRGWLERLTAGGLEARAAAAEVITVYGLTARFSLILERATTAAHEVQKAALPEGLEDEVLDAMEVGLAASLRARLLGEIERATRDFARARADAADPASGRAFSGAIADLEHAAGLLRLNLNESAALEDFLLASLRRWTRR